MKTDYCVWAEEMATTSKDNLVQISYQKQLRTFLSWYFWLWYFMLGKLLPDLSVFICVEPFASLELPKRLKDCHKLPVTLF